MEIYAKVGGKIMKCQALTVTVDELIEKGYGDKQDNRLTLESYEALYLLDNGMISVYDGVHELEFSSLFKLISHQKQGFSKYLVYKDLRDRGYVVKEGVEPLYSFRLFEKGSFSSAPAKYRITILNEGDDIKVDKLKNYLVSSVNQEKESIVAVVDRRGEIIYYKGFLITSGNKIE